MLDKLKEKTNIRLIFSILIFFLVIFPYLVAATFASPSADDFTNLNSVLSQTNSSFVGKAIRTSINTYKGWQGTYTGLFLCYLGGGIYQKFGVVGLQSEYFFNIVFFFFSVWCVVANIVKKFDIEKKEFISLSLAITSLLSFVILYNFDIGEVFYWHTGLTVYTVPLSFSLLTVAFLLKKDLKVCEVILVSLFGFLAAGGSLDITAFVCGTSLLITAYKLLVNKSISNSIVVFVASLVGAIINVAAPGNYSRHAAISDKFPVLNSIKYSFSGVFKALWEYVGNGTIIFLLLLCLFLFNKLKKMDIKFVNPVLIAIILFMGSVIIDFPVYLGYAGGGLPDRCIFVRRVSMTLFLLVVMLDTIGWFAQKTDKKICFTIENCMALVVTVVIALNACVPVGSWDGVKPFKIYNDIFFNSIDQRLTTYENTTNMILDTLKTSPGEDVVINIPDYDSLGYLKTLGLRDDATNWVNVGIAEYFGNKSIVLNVGQ